MTRISLSIEVAESVDPAALGRWLEGWIRDQWGTDGEPAGPTCSACSGGFPIEDEVSACCGRRRGQTAPLHLENVEAKPPASGRNLHEAQSVCQNPLGCGAPVSPGIRYCQRSCQEDAENFA